MNKIDKLIQELCPDGVEYKPIEEIFLLRNGYTPSKRNGSYWKNGTINWFRMEDIRINGNILNGSIQKVSKDGIKGKLFPANTIIMATTATIGEHALITVDFLCNQQLTAFILKDIYKERYNINFLYHYFYIVDEYAKNNVNASSMPSVQMNKLRNYFIPIPPIEIQKEIVNILDKYVKLEAELEAELDAELEAREQQYEFYRGKILDFDGNYYKLKDLCLKTDNIKWKEIDNAKSFQYIDLSSVNRKNNKIIETRTITKTDYPSRAQKIIFNEDIIFGTTRPTLMRYCFITEKYDKQICSTGYSVLRANRKLITPKYLFYILTTKDFYDYIEENQEGASYPAISDSKLKKYLVSIPGLEDQNKIVSILDKFDKLINDISDGLPAEKEMRKKQYEYYLDKLLTFKEIK